MKGKSEKKKRDPTVEEKEHGGYALPESEKKDEGKSSPPPPQPGRDTSIKKQGRSRREGYPLRDPVSRREMVQTFCRRKKMKPGGQKGGQLVQKSKSERKVLRKKRKTKQKKTRSSQKKAPK